MAAGAHRAPGGHAVSVAAAFRSRLEPGGRLAGAFGHVVSGIPDRTRGSAVRAAFERGFGDLPSGPVPVSSSRTAPAAADARG